MAKETVPNRRRCAVAVGRAVEDELLRTTARATPSAVNEITATPVLMIRTASFGVNAESGGTILLFAATRHDAPVQNGTGRDSDRRHGPSL